MAVQSSRNKAPEKEEGCVSALLSHRYQQVKDENGRCVVYFWWANDPPSRDEIHRRGMGSGSSARACNWSRETGRGSGKPDWRITRFDRDFEREIYGSQRAQLQKYPVTRNTETSNRGKGVRKQRVSEDLCHNQQTLHPEMEWPLVAVKSHATHICYS